MSNRLAQRATIPEGWAFLHLHEVMKLVRRKVDVIGDHQYTEIGIRSHGKGIFHKEHILGSQLGDKRVFWVKPGDFILNIVFAWEDAVAIVSEDEHGMIASHRFPTFVVNPEICDVVYIWRYFLSQDGIEQLKSVSPGGAGRNKTLNQSAFLKLQMPLPPLPEQRAIAAILATWDEAIALTDRLIAALQRRKQALMHLLLTGEVRFPEFEGVGWVERTISEIALVTMGQSPDSQYYNSDGNGLPLIQGNADISNRVSAPRSFTSQITKICQIGDVLISVRAPVGETAISLHNACIGRGIAAIRATDCDSDFLYQLILAQETRWTKFAQGSTFSAINSDDIRNLDIQIPSSLAEQETIGRALAVCDEQIVIMQQLKSKLHVEKCGLMQRLLTGTIRV